MTSIVVNAAGFPLDAWRLISPQLTAERRQRFQQVVAARTNFIRLVIQDIHHPHNVSACLRSAEAFGVNNVHVVTMREKFKPSTVTRGVEQWMNVHRHNSVKDCVGQLRQQGYRLATALPSPTATPLQNLPIDKPLAVIFGNEHDGVDPDWESEVDIRFTVPMVGFVESLNISVSAAITLSNLIDRGRALHGTDFFLSEAEQNAELCTWSCRQLRSYRQQLERLRAAASQELLS